MSQFRAFTVNSSYTSDLDLNNCAMKGGVYTRLSGGFDCKGENTPRDGYSFDWSHSGGVGNQGYLVMTGENPVTKSILRHARKGVNVSHSLVCYVLWQNFFASNWATMTPIQAQKEAVKQAAKAKRAEARHWAEVEAMEQEEYEQMNAHQILWDHEDEEAENALSSVPFADVANLFLGENAY